MRALVRTMGVMMSCKTTCPCRGTGSVVRTATEYRGGKVLRSWTYLAECPARARREVGTVAP